MYLLFHTFVLNYFIHVLPLLVLYSLKLPYILCLVFVIDSKKVMLSRQGTKSYFSNKKYFLCPNHFLLRKTNSLIRAQL